MRLQPDEIAEVVFDDGTVGFYTSCDEEFLSDVLSEYRSITIKKKPEYEPGWVEDDPTPTLRFGDFSGSND